MTKFVDLAALSMSGSLVPSVPTELGVKYNPPKLTIIYHFEKKSNEQFYHDINLDTQFLEHNSTEEVVSHLYVTEAYYLNPKQVKRTQLLRLVGLIQNNIAANKPQNTRRKNFLERKRFINYEDNKQRQTSTPEETVEQVPIVSKKESL
jgi:hypothetical protein